MSKLNFSTFRTFTKSATDAAIVNIPDDTLELLTVEQGLLKKAVATLDVNKNYAGITFSASTVLPYGTVTNMRFKGFPQYGSYGFINDANSHSLVLLKI